MKERRERNFRILEFRENKFDIIGDVHGCYDEPSFFSAMRKRMAVIRIRRAEG